MVIEKWISAWVLAIFLDLYCWSVDFWAQATIGLQFVFYRKWMIFWEALIDRIVISRVSCCLMLSYQVCECVLLYQSMRYQELQIERQLLGSNTDTTSLSILQRNSIAHLKETQENNHIYYHSSDTHQEALRVIIFALLTKIYTAYSLSNAHRLHTLKNIVYSSPLSVQMTDSRGIEKKQLLKLFAEKINSLVIDSGVQVTLCNLMNSSNFFEEILLLAFEQAIAAWLQEQKGGESMIDRQKHEFKLEDCLNFVREHFDLQIRILPMAEINGVQQQNQIVLYRVNEHLYKKSAKSIGIELSSVSSSSIKESNAIENKPIFTLQSIKMNETRLEEMSPLQFSAKHKSSPHDSDRSGRKLLAESSGQKKRRKKKQEESSSFFSLFCCCN